MGSRVKVWICQIRWHDCTLDYSLNNLCLFVSYCAIIVNDPSPAFEEWRPFFLIAVMVLIDCLLSQCSPCGLAGQSSQSHIGNVYLACYLGFVVPLSNKTSSAEPPKCWWCEQRYSKMALGPFGKSHWKANFAQKSTYSTSWFRARNLWSGVECEQHLKLYLTWQMIFPIPHSAVIKFSSPLANWGAPDRWAPLGSSHI